MPGRVAAWLDDLGRGVDLVERAVEVLAPLARRCCRIALLLYVALSAAFFVGFTTSYDRYLAWKHASATVESYLGGEDAAVDVRLPGGEHLRTTFGSLVTASVISHRAAGVRRTLLNALALSGIAMGALTTVFILVLARMGSIVVCPVRTPARVVEAQYSIVRLPRPALSAFKADQLVGDESERGEEFDAKVLPAIPQRLASSSEAVQEDVESEPAPTVTVAVPYREPKQKTKSEASEASVQQGLVYGSTPTAPRPRRLPERRVRR